MCYKISRSIGFKFQILKVLSSSHSKVHITIELKEKYVYTNSVLTVGNPQLLIILSLIPFTFCFQHSQLTQTLQIDIKRTETCSKRNTVKTLLLMENIKTYDLNAAVITTKEHISSNYRPNHCYPLTIYPFTILCTMKNYYSSIGVHAYE